MRTARFFLLLCLPITLPVAGRSQAVQRPETPPVPLQSQAVGRSALIYRLNLSDTLDVSLPYSPEYNQSVTVQPDGSISLREIAPVYVTGLTIPEAETLIAKAYSTVLRAPKVSILLKDFLKPSYYASGEIGRPGRYELRSSTTLLEALSEAGGLLNERAAKKQVVVFRPPGQRHLRIQDHRRQSGLEGDRNP